MVKEAKKKTEKVRNYVSGCSCDDPYDESQTQMQCGMCADWFHVECVPYTCVKCSEEKQKRVDKELERLNEKISAYRAENKQLKDMKGKSGCSKCESIEEINKNEVAYYKEREVDMQKQHQKKIEKLNQKIAEQNIEITKKKSSISERDDEVTKEKNERKRIAKENTENRKTIDALEKEKLELTKNEHKLR